MVAHRSLFTTLSFLAGLTAAGAFAVPALAADNCLGCAPGNEAGSKTSTPGATPSSGASNPVEAAQKKLETEDPTKIVKKADPANEKPAPDPAVAMQANGMWQDKDGNPTPHFAKDGTMDWFTFSGYRRYGANCLQCHGPDALGSSYAPSLVDALKTLDYGTFLQTVAAGKKDVNNSSNLVMPSFGDNKNVQCYVNDIYVYLRARALGLLDRQRPSKHEDKPEIYGAQETACLGF